jgi:hypothetical protein
MCESLTFLDLPLDKDGESLVEPEMLEALVGHEVPGPGVCNLVSDHVSVRLQNIHELQDYNQ